MGQSNRSRLLQIGRWLAARFPTPYPTRLRLVRKIAAGKDATPMERRTGDWGETYREGRRVTVRVACRPGLSRSAMIETLLHEWAHAASIRHESIEEQRRELGGHDSEWALMYGRIYRAFIDEGGAEESREF